MGFCMLHNQTAVLEPSKHLHTQIQEKESHPPAAESFAWGAAASAASDHLLQHVYSQGVEPVADLVEPSAYRNWGRVQVSSQEQVAAGSQMQAVTT